MKKFFMFLLLGGLLTTMPGQAWAQSASDLILLGNEAATMENYGQAIDYYTKAINANQLNARQLAVAYNNRGCAYDDSGMDNQAMADFAKAIELDSGYDAPYFSRSFIYERRNELDKAIVDMEKAVSLDPGFEDFQLRLEWLYDQKQRQQ